MATQNCDDNLNDSQMTCPATQNSSSSLSYCYSLSDYNVLASYFLTCAFPTFHIAIGKLDTWHPVVRSRRIPSWDS